MLQLSVYFHDFDDLHFLDEFPVFQVEHSFVLGRRRVISFRLDLIVVVLFEETGKRVGGWRWGVKPSLHRGFLLLRLDHFSLCVEAVGLVVLGLSVGSQRSHQVERFVAQVARVELVRPWLSWRGLILDLSIEKLWCVLLDELVDVFSRPLAAESASSALHVLGGGPPAPEQPVPFPAGAAT